MNTCRTIVGVIGLVGLGLALGCVQGERDRSLAAAQPTPDEVAPLPEMGRSPHQASVRVEGRFDKATLVLVPEYKVPEPTPEEKEILGIEEDDYEPLLYELSWRQTGNLTSFEFGGPETAVFGHSGGEYRTDIGNPIDLNVWGNAMMSTAISADPRNYRVGPKPDPIGSYLHRTDLDTRTGLPKDKRIRTYKPRD
jgi:hypothetical protein